jgi:hypothetical protein
MSGAVPANDYMYKLHGGGKRVGKRQLLNWEKVSVL